MIIRDVIAEVERLAPTHLAEAWDNVGLQIGGVSAPVDKILLALDATDAVVGEAIDHGAGLIICHHPLIHGELKNIDHDDPLGARIRKLLKNDITVYVAHTNLDKAAGGVNDALAAALGISNTKPLIPEKAILYKLVVFVPDEGGDAVRRALGESGAGAIGNYANCSFETAGIGTFKPVDGAKPSLGCVGEETRTSEIRLEVLVDSGNLDKVIAAMIDSHPYEEVAYDLYPLSATDRSNGMGRIGDLNEAVSMDTFIDRCRRNLDVEPLASHGIPMVKRVAVCGGSGAGLIEKAKGSGADVLVTGDIKYHAAQLAREIDLAVIDCGHDSTEKPALATLKSYLEDKLDNDIDIVISREPTSPWRLND